MKTTSEEPATQVTINPFVDWGFKFLFGREETKDLLMGFLNLLLKPDVPFTEITYLNPEVIPEQPQMKRCVFDVLCKDANGERYLIEMQKAWRQDMGNRIVYYLCRLIDRMGRHSVTWDYAMIKRVYAICIMDFTYEEHPQLRHDIMLRNRDGSPYSDLLNIITLQIPCIHAKTLSESTESYEILLNFLYKSHHRTAQTFPANVVPIPFPTTTFPAMLFTRVKGDNNKTISSSGSMATHWRPTPHKA